MVRKKEDKKKASWGSLVLGEAKGFFKTTKKEAKEWRGASFRLASDTKKPKRFSKKEKGK